jgi:hypothetical protein
MKKALSLLLGLVTLVAATFATGILARLLWELFLLGWNLLR